MTIASGTRLGAYEILSALGAGGMGEVYRARDTRLDRDVAIKLLPELFAADPDRLVRFEREAKTLAALNHPNIAAIYGIEETAPSTSAGQAVMRALVLELVDGPTLADRIARGPLPLDEALPIARQICEALEAAHEHGIIHRDLKPANIKLRPDGVVKVLDFGLAKLTQASGPGPRASDLTASPTVTSPAVTRLGVILGTAAYMAPEQARGKAVDKRADIWAFGCVLYEMLTGQRAFGGEEVSDTLAHVLMKEPAWTALPAGAPAAIRRLLRRCLEKDRARRLDSAAAARLEIEDSLAPSIDDIAAGVRVNRQTRWRLALVAVATVVLSAMLASAMTWMRTRPAPRQVTRTTVSTSSAEALYASAGGRDLAITPDGTRVVYLGSNGTQIFVRALDQLRPTALGGLGAPRGPFVSPDGQWIGFFDGVTLKKVAITGGPPVMLCPIDGSYSGATWNSDGIIVFATGAASGLQQVSAAGGNPTVLTTPNPERGEADHVWPEFLPGGHGVLFTIAAATGSIEDSQVAVLDLRSGEQKILIRGGSSAHYVASGHLVYGVAGTVRAVDFDLARLETMGAPVPVVPDVLTKGNSGVADFDVSGNGTLVYVSGDALFSGSPRTIVWVDRQGRETPIAAPPREYNDPRLSPDGTRIAVAATDQENDIWVWDLSRQTLTRLTFERQADGWPIWVPDGERIVFNSLRASRLANVFIQAASGTGSATRLTEASNAQFPTSITPDGTQVVFHENTLDRANDLRLLTLTPTPRVEPLLETRFDERNGVVSPDGRWLAYQSNSSGRYEIYVRPFPDVSGGQWQVSTGGGIQPLWARNGQELFYVDALGPFAPQSLMTVPFSARGDTWSPGAPRRLFEDRFGLGDAGDNIQYDVTPDGRRFLRIRGVSGDQAVAPPEIVVVQNWIDELKRLVPVQ